MSITLPGLRKAAATVLLLLAVGSSVTACAYIHPDNRPFSPVFKGGPR